MYPIIRKTTALLSAAATAALLCSGAFAAQSQTTAPGWCSLEHDHACHALCTLEHDHALDAYCWRCHDCAQGCWNRYWDWFSASDTTDSTAVNANTAVNTSNADSSAASTTGGWYCQRVNGVCPNPDCPNPDCPSPDCPNPACPNSAYPSGTYYGGHHGGGHHGRHH